MFEVAGIETEIIAASVRNPIHVTDCALAGADIATVPYAVIEQMTHHPLTDAGIEKFKKDYIAVFGEQVEPVIDYRKTVNNSMNTQNQEASHGQIRINENSQRSP